MRESTTALRDPDVFEQLPRRVLEAGGAGAAPVGRDAVDRLVEADVRVLPVENAGQLIAESRSRFAHMSLVLYFGLASGSRWVRGNRPARASFTASLSAAAAPRTSR